MDSDLKQVFELCQDNNKILRGMRRSARIGSFFRFIYLALIIGSVVGSYYYLQPYIDQIFNLYSEINSTVGDIQDKAGRIPDPSKLNLPPEIQGQLDSILKRK